MNEDQRVWLWTAGIRTQLLDIHLIAEDVLILALPVIDIATTDIKVFTADECFLGRGIHVDLSAG